MLQYIVSESDANKMISIACEAIENGCRWIRLDISKLASNEAHEAILAIIEKGEPSEVILSLENDLEAATRMKVSGIHFDSSKISFLVESRKALGEETIMGFSVENPSQVPFLPRTAIDYITTEGKDLDNCRKIVQQMRALNLNEPVVATYTPSVPLSELMSTGIDGIVADNLTTPPSSLKSLIEDITAIIEQRLNSIK